MWRVITDIILVLLVFLVPWWLVLLVAVLASWYFPSFYELLFLGLVIDSLYNAPIARFHHVEFFVTLVAVILFIFIETLKRRLRLTR